MKPTPTLYLLRKDGLVTAYRDPACTAPYYTFRGAQPPRRRNVQIPVGTSGTVTEIWRAVWIEPVAKQIAAELARRAERWSGGRAAASRPGRAGHPTRLSDPHSGADPDLFDAPCREPDVSRETPG